MTRGDMCACSTRNEGTSSLAPVMLPATRRTGQITGLHLNQMAPAKAGAVPNTYLASRDDWNKAAIAARTDKILKEVKSILSVREEQ